MSKASGDRGGRYSLRRRELPPQYDDEDENMMPERSSQNATDLLMSCIDNTRINNNSISDEIGAGLAV